MAQGKQSDEANKLPLSPRPPPPHLFTPCISQHCTKARLVSLIKSGKKQRKKTKQENYKKKYLGKVLELAGATEGRQTAADLLS